VLLQEKRSNFTASARNPAPARRTRAVREVRKLCSAEVATAPVLFKLEIPIPDCTVLIFFFVPVVPFFFVGAAIEVNWSCVSK
jgi:hypothetical protein